MELSILGAHDLESKNAHPTSLLIDSRLVIDAGGLTSSLTLTQQQEIRAILLTHHHFDHTRDLPTFGFNVVLWQGQVTVHALPQTFEVIVPCLLDGRIYDNLLGCHSTVLKGAMCTDSVLPEDEKPPLKLCSIEPYQKETIIGYEVLPVPVNHSVPAVGYLVSSPGGNSLFYTGDTGPGLSDCWRHISPQMLIIEATAPSRFTNELANKGHLSPQSLKEELAQFQLIKGYLPRVIVIHMALPYEQEIKAEIIQVAEELQADISLGYEGMKAVV
jgi:ribonuclease BN (tRNA processing enzyme)